MSEKTEQHKCGMVSVDAESGIVTTTGVTFLRDCSDGCCSTYRCDGCAKTFRVEFPS